MAGACGMCVGGLWGLAFSSVAAGPSETPSAAVVMHVHTRTDCTMEPSPPCLDAALNCQPAPSSTLDTVGTRAQGTSSWAGREWAFWGMGFTRTQALDRRASRGALRRGRRSRLCPSSRVWTGLSPSRPGTIQPGRPQATASRGARALQPCPRGTAVLWGGHLASEGPVYDTQRRVGYSL